jgi:hypothetical protein
LYHICYQWFMSCWDVPMVPPMNFAVFDMQTGDYVFGEGPWNGTAHPPSMRFADS